MGVDFGGVIAGNRLLACEIPLRGMRSRRMFPRTIDFSKDFIETSHCGILTPAPDSGSSASPPFATPKLGHLYVASNAVRLRRARLNSPKPFPSSCTFTFSNPTWSCSVLASSSMLASPLSTGTLWAISLNSSSCKRDRYRHRHRHRHRYWRRVDRGRVQTHTRTIRSTDGGYREIGWQADVNNGSIGYLSVKIHKHSIFGMSNRMCSSCVCHVNTYSYQPRSFLFASNQP